MRALIVALAMPCLLIGGIPQDKQKHLVAGALIGGTVTLIAKGQGSKHPELWGIGAALLAGALKESADRRSAGNRWDGKDVSATVAGGIVLSYSVRW